MAAKKAKKILPKKVKIRKKEKRKQLIILFY